MNFLPEQNSKNIPQKPGLPPQGQIPRPSAPSGKSENNIKASSLSTSKPSANIPKPPMKKNTGASFQVPVPPAKINGGGIPVPKVDNHTFPKSNEKIVIPQPFSPKQSSDFSKASEEQSKGANSIVDTQQETKSAESSPNYGINFVPQNNSRLLKEEFPARIKYFLIIVVMVVAANIGIWAYLTWNDLKIFTQIQEVNGEIENNRVVLLQYNSDVNEVIKIRQRYETVKELLANHVYWTKFFMLLEKYTLKDVYFTGFSVQSTQGATISLNAKAKSIPVVAQQLSVLQDASDFVKDVSINALTVENSSQNDEAGNPLTIVNFTVNITLVDDVFFKFLSE